MSGRLRSAIPLIRARLRCVSYGRLVPGEQLDDALHDAIVVDTEVVEHPRRDTITFAEEPDQEVLGADVVVPELERGRQRQFERAHRTRREREIASGAAASARNLVEHPLDDDAARDRQLGEDDRRKRVGVVEEREEQVLRSAMVVLERPRFVVRTRKDRSSTAGEALERQRQRHAQCDESLLDCLLRHAEGTADLRPRVAVAPATVDEHPEERVAELREHGRGRRRVGELPERVARCGVLHGANDRVERQVELHCHRSTLR